MRIIIPDTTKNLLLAGAALFLGALHTYLFLDEMVGLNYPLFIIAALVCGLGLSYVFHRSVTRDSFVLIGLAVFFSAMVFVRESELLTFFNILGSILLLFIAIDLFSGKKLREYLVIDFLKAATLPFRCIGPFFETAPALFTLRNFAIHNKNTKEIVRGTIMAAVLLSLFTWLLAGADAHFAHFFNTFFSFSLDENAIPYIIRTVFIAAFFIGAFGFMFRTHERGATPSPAHVRNLGLIETSIVLGAINILFLTFIVLQISTLFGGETHLTTEGLTYAEYARNGFFQLLWVAIFSFVIITVTEMRIITRDTGHVRLFKVLSGTLILLVVTILASAFLRLSLYEQAYGFTDTRLYSHALMIWLAVGLILLCYHIARNGRREVLALRLFYTTVAFLFALNLLNPDVFIAQKNLTRYHETGKIDAAYLAYLSNDALPYTIALARDPNDGVRTSYIDALQRKHSTCAADDCTPSWKTFQRNTTQTESLLREYLSKNIEPAE